MKKIALISMMMLMSVATFASKHVSNDAVVVADTIYYSADQLSVSDEIGRASCRERV